MPPEGLIGVALGVIAILLVAALVVPRFVVKVPSGHALVIHGAGGRSRVAFKSALVMPIFGLGELVDCSMKTMLVQRRGHEGYRCSDKLRASVTAEVRLRVNPTGEDVRRAAARLGAARTFDPAALTTLFHGKVDEAIATVIGNLTFDQLVARRGEARDRVIEVIGRDLDGYVLEDVSLVAIDQVPVEQLDPNHVHDAEAIRRITERTAEDRARTNAVRTETAREDQRERLDAAERDLRGSGRT